MLTNPAAGPRRWALFLAASLLALVGAWLLLRSYTSDAARECLALYRSAANAADTARIDTLVPRGSRSEADPRTCGFIRTSARWQ
jgi:hypothetical protein